MTAEESYKAWACAGCFGKEFIAGFKHGVTVEKKNEFARNSTVTLTYGGKSITLSKQKYNKTVESKHRFMRIMGHAPDGPIDTQYVSYLSCEGSVDGVADEDLTYASYSYSSENEDSIIYYADLRDDILVYWHETSSGNATTVPGTAPMGMGLGYGGFQGGEAACKGVNTLDAVKLEPTFSASKTRTEKISLGEHTVYTNTISSPANVTIAVNTGAPSCGGVSDECVHWGGYDRIDTTKPYNCSEGIYQVEALVEKPEEYYCSWEDFGTYPAMTQYDRTQWIGLAFDGWDNGTFTDRVSAGTHDYPSFINIDPMPRGSFVTDKEGNRFYSMVTTGLTVFNKLNDEDPNTISQLEGAGIVYYPVSPC